MAKRILVWVAFILMAQMFSGCEKERMEFFSMLKGSSTEPIVSKIAFGSCGQQVDPQPILKKVVAANPDYFVFLGDNIYSDTKSSIAFIKLNYSLLGAKPEFQTLRKKVKTLATWDDHDFGLNDAGGEYPIKEPSRRVFLNFWKEPAASPRWQRDGVYTSYYFGDDDHKIQLILLDMRYNRSSLSNSSSGYVPNSDPAKTFLGANQWAWLKTELLKPAKVRIIGSSTQFGVEHNGWEAWANFPLEQQKMFDLIKETQAEGVMYISGDVHYSEISKRQVDGLYPIYDMTGSGITQEESNAAPNVYRVAGPYTPNHFGMININWNVSPVIIHMSAIGKDGLEKYGYNISLDDLKF